MWPDTHVAKHTSPLDVHAANFERTTLECPRDGLFTLWVIWRLIIGHHRVGNMRHTGGSGCPAQAIVAQSSRYGTERRHDFPNSNGNFLLPAKRLEWTSVANRPSYDLSPRIFS